MTVLHLQYERHANLRQDGGFIGGLVLLLLLWRPLLHLLPVRLLLSVCTFRLEQVMVLGWGLGGGHTAVNQRFLPSSHLKDFDLAGGGVEVLRVLLILVLFERVDLDAERHALFSSMFSHGEFCANAVYLQQ